VGASREVTKWDDEAAAAVLEKTLVEPQEQQAFFDAYTSPPPANKKTDFAARSRPERCHSVMAHLLLLACIVAISAHAAVIGSYALLFDTGPSLCAVHKIGASLQAALPALSHGAAASFLFVVWLAQREPSRWRWFLWSVAALLLGSPATGLYIIGALWRARIERSGMVNWPRFWLGDTSKLAPMAPESPGFGTPSIK
jgi:hypothetical protein